MSSKEVLQISIKAVVPTANGSALFLGNEEKVFCDLHGSASRPMRFKCYWRERRMSAPSPHDLIGNATDRTRRQGGSRDHQRSQGATYYARMIVSVENELQQRKVIELDARPSGLPLPIGLVNKTPPSISPAQSGMKSRICPKSSRG